MDEIGHRPIPYTELPEMNDGGPLCEEWNTYRREVARLLTESHEGTFVLIKGDQIVSLHDSSGADRGRASGSICWSHSWSMRSAL